MDRLMRWIFRPFLLQVVFVVVLAVFTVVSVIIVNSNDGKTSLKDVEQKAGLTVDIKHLISLGLPCRPEDVKNIQNVENVTYCEWWRRRGMTRDGNRTAIVTIVKPKETGDSVNLVRNVRHLIPMSDIVIFDLGITKYGDKLLAIYCKELEKCRLRKLDDELPGRFHVPLAIQTTLSLGYENVVYISPLKILTSGNLTETLKKISETGVAGWKMGDVSWPMTSITHPNMFSKLSAQNNDYRFQHAVSTDVLAIKNSKFVVEKRHVAVDQMRSRSRLYQSGWGPELRVQI